ncbi:MAG: hypothetical protein IPO27_18215 [Bacteroidetes bacterium]|nr:hypothetical protein [Bacteroidota bacterium]
MKAYNLILLSSNIDPGITIGELKLLSNTEYQVSINLTPPQPPGTDVWIRGSIKIMTPM